jgi:alkanesulfonate monooxygenase SsuD/methylene tetrahydromethanopterin reductase-like flavin-dependent oxidoreductase (luciferase family)
MTMPEAIIGAHLMAPDAPLLLRAVEHAESLGIPAVWLISNPVDPLALLAAAAARTQRILLGTAVIRTYPCHPIVAAQQATVIANLTPGRFRLGVGPSGANNENVYGIPYLRPLAHLRAYVKAAKALLQEGAVDQDEAGVVARFTLPQPPPGVPVLASALRRRSFALCGEVADGAITWLCPDGYVQAVALPALRAGAARAGRAAPPLIMHVPVCLDTDAAAVRQAVRQRLGFYPTLPHYVAMFEAAGFPEVRDGQWSDRMIDAVVVHGTEAVVAERLQQLRRACGGELMVSPMPVPVDPEGSAERVLRLVADLAR